MSNRSKRKLEQFDPNQSDPEDLDYGASPPPKPQRRVKKTGKSSRPSKRQRYGDSDDDIEDDDEDSIEEDSFGDASDDEDVEVNPRTGRASRKVTKKAVNYEESDEDDEDKDDIEDSDEDDDGRDELADSPEKPRRAERQSLIVKLKLPPGSSTAMPSSSAPRRSSRAASRGLRGSSEAPAGPSGTRRSSRISHDDSEPLVELTTSGRHASVTREGTRSPEPFAARPTRGGKGLKKPPSAIMEASQETSSKEALASFESGVGQAASNDVDEAEEEVADTQPEAEDDDADMGEGIVLQSEQDDDDDDDMPVGSKRRSQRVRNESDNVLRSMLTR